MLSDSLGLPSSERAALQNKMVTPDWDSLSLEDLREVVKLLDATVRQFGGSLQELSERVGSLEQKATDKS